MQAFRSITLGLIFSWLTGCASELTSPLFVESAQPEPGYAMLYIYRPADPYGAAIWPEVYINEQQVVGLMNGGYASMQIKPGHYRITTKNNSLLSGDEPVTGEFDIQTQGAYFLKYNFTYETYTGYTSIGAGSVIPVERHTNEKTQWSMMEAAQGQKEIALCRIIPSFISKLK